MVAFSSLEGFTPSESFKERAASIMAVAACGDAVGAPYEFNERMLAPGEIPSLHIYGYGTPAGTWTDDTSQALCLAWAFTRQGLAKSTPGGGSAWEEEAAELFLEWFLEDGSGVGNQTATVFEGLDFRKVSAEVLRTRSKDYHLAFPKGSAGNGGLMRVHPVACLPVGRKEAATIARAATSLTHFDPLCQEASVLWVELLRVAAQEGVLEPLAGLDLLPQDRQDYWQEVVSQALSTPSEVFSHEPWWTVPTFQQALAAVKAHEEEVRAGSVVEVFTEVALAEDSDTDTVLSVAGGLCGALGASRATLPEQWQAWVGGLWPRRMTLGEVEHLGRALTEVDLPGLPK